MAVGALSIKLRCASWQQLATIYKRDLSRGTMFLKASTPPPLGTSVRIDLTLPSSSVIVLTGVVQQHVKDDARGQGVELKLAPIPTGSIWLIESALSSEQKRPTPSGGLPAVRPPTVSGPVASVSDGADLADAEEELVRALMAEAESLKKLNPFLVLGVGYEATDSDVRAAFGELTKRYHPDRFARYGSAQLRAVAAEIFILIRDAYRRLGDEGGRAQVLTSLGRAPAPRAVPAPRAATAPGVVPPPPVSRTQGIPVASTPAPRAITDVKSGPVRVPALDPPTIPVNPGAVRLVTEGVPTVPQSPRPAEPPKASQAIPSITKPAAEAEPPKMIPAITRPDLPKRPATEPGMARSQPMPAVKPDDGRRTPPLGQAPIGEGRRTPPLGVPVRAQSEPPVRPTPPRLEQELPPAATERKPVLASPPTVIGDDTSELDAMLDRGDFDQAVAGYKLLAKKHPNDRSFRAGIDLCEGLRALSLRDRLEAAQRFESALEIDPANERAARELAEMRRQATNERKGLLSRLMGKKES